MSTIVTPEAIQRNIQRIVAESPSSVRALSVTSGIPQTSLTRKLAGEECMWSIGEVASLARALGINLEAFLDPAGETI